MKGIRRGICLSVTKANKPTICGGLCEWSGCWRCLIDQARASSLALS